jgi:hypothetical protein
MLAVVVDLWRKRSTHFRGFIAAVVGFALTPVMWAAATSTAFGHQRAAGIFVLAAPLVGYAFVLRAFDRWRDLHSRMRMLFVCVSGLYWAVYGPFVYVWWIVLLVGWAGGI